MFQVMREERKSRIWIGRMVRLLANDLDLRVEHLEWLPDTADCEHLRLIVDGDERRIEFRKALLKKNLAHQNMALEATYAKVTRALCKKV
jgi:hypothetical protein